LTLWKVIYPFTHPTPPSPGFSWTFEPPIPPEFPIPSVVGVWIIFGTTHFMILKLLKRIRAKKPKLKPVYACT